MNYRFPGPQRLVTGLAILVAPATAFAYVGPGAGITAIGSVLALLVGILLAIVGFIWYPLKRFLRTRSGKTEAGGTAEKNSTEETGSQGKN